MAVFALMMATALLATDPDGVVGTAPDTAVDLGATARPVAAPVEHSGQDRTPHGLSTDEQIDRWIAARATADRSWGEATAEPEDDDRVYGEVSVSLGTGGYRDYGAAVSLPIGQHGRMDLSYRHVENAPGYGAYGYGRGYDPLYFDDSGYVFPGYQPGAAAEYERRVMRPEGPPRRFRSVEPNRAGDD